MEIAEMYLENTKLAPRGSWRKTKIEDELACDIACAMAARRCGDAANDREHRPEAYRLLACSSRTKNVTRTTVWRSKRGFRAAWKTASSSASCPLARGS